MGKVRGCGAFWMLEWSITLFSLMGRDKRLARAGGRRIPEKRLFLLAALGGAVGGVAGMAVFRHKTKHMSFILGFRALALVQLAALVFLIVKCA